MVMLAAPSATPEVVDATQITPGVIGFLTIFALALVSWLLFRSMSKRVRRINRHSAPVSPGSTPPNGAQPSKPSEADADPASNAADPTSAPPPPPPFPRG